MGKRASRLSVSNTTARGAVVFDFLWASLGIFYVEGVAELRDFIYNENGRVMDAETKDARPAAGKRRNAMREHGLKVKDFVSLFHLEVLNQGSDFDSALMTVPDLNRPGLQFQDRKSVV